MNNNSTTTTSHHNRILDSIDPNAESALPSVVIIKNDFSIIVNFILYLDIFE
jgi:hypothetical protein